MAFSSNKPSHLKALLKKNWILWKRSWIISILEILIPILFAIIMYAFRQADSPEYVPETTYYDNPTTLFDYQGILDSPHLKYIKDCTAPENGGVVALAPSGDSLVTELDTILSKYYLSRFFINPLLQKQLDIRLIHSLRLLILT